MSSVNKLVCIICLKKFNPSVTENSNENIPPDENLSFRKPECENLNISSETPQGNVIDIDSRNYDPYTRFLLFVKRYFKLTTFADRLLTCAKEAKNENGERTKLQTFCGSCGQLVSEICALYKELQTTQLFLLWKLGLVGELMKKSSGHATDDKTYKSWGARSSMAKQMNVIAVKPVDMFRKALQLKCVNVARKGKTKPVVAIYKGLVSDEWKFTYSATKEALIRLIVLFTLASNQLSLNLPKRNSEVKTKLVKNVAKRRTGPPKKKQKPSQKTPDQIVVKNENRIDEVADITTTIADPSVLQDDDKHEPDNLENDSDWSRDAATPNSVGSIPSENHDEIQWTLETYSKAGLKRGRRNLVVIAEEDEEYAMKDGDSSKIMVPKSKESNIIHSEKEQCPVDIAPSVQCFQYKRVISNVQVAVNLYSDHRTDSEKYPCNKCDMRFPRYMDRRAHERKVHRYFATPVNTNVKPTPKRPIGDIVVKQEINEDSTQEDTEEAEQLEMGNPNHSSKSGTKEKLKCPKCPKLFIDGRGLVNHLKMFHRTSIEYPCKTCGMSFKRQRLLRNHQRKMHGSYRISSTCPKCSQVFPSRTELCRHQKKTHKPSNRGCYLISSECPKCSEVFPSRTELFRHQKKMHKLKRGARPVPSTCSKCSEVLPSNQKLLLHMKIAHRSKLHNRGRPKGGDAELRCLNEQLICEVEKCGENFEMPSLLRKHLETVHEDSGILNINCSYCRSRKSFAYRQTYEMHLRTAHKNQIFGMYKCDLKTCKVDSFRSLDKLNEHLKIHLEEPESGIKEISFCEKCNWGFTKPESRDLHQLCHISPGDDGKMNCPQCSGRYGPNVKYLQNHFNIKHGVNLRSFECDLCQGTFLSRWYLDQHKCSHPTQRRIRKETTECVCELCGAQFPERCRLNVHMKRHAEPKFSCDVCGALFKFKPKLNDHKKQMHDPDRSKSFICSECGKSFYSDIGLKFHFDSAHKAESEWDLKCPKCPRRFYRKLYLGIHLKTCDGNEEEEKKRLENEMKETSSTANETEKAGAQLSTGSPQAQQNDLHEGLSSLSILKQPPIFQSDSMQFDQQPTELSPPELPEMAFSPLPPNSPLENQVLLDSDDDDPTPDNFGNEDDSDWSQGGTSPMSGGGNASSDEDLEETNVVGIGTKWNLRGHRNLAVKVEEEDEESSEKIQNSEKDPLHHVPSPSIKEDSESEISTKSEEKKEEFNCPHCPKKCKKINGLAVHLKVHGDRIKIKHSCKKCGMCFKTRAVLLSHIKRVHLNQRKVIEYKCPMCLNVLPSKFKLLQHMTSVHEKEKPEVEKTIQCCHCNQSYAYQETYDLHLKTTHRRKLRQGFKCDLENCEEKPFVSMEMLNDHLKSHLGEFDKISFCEKCNWGFLRPEIKDLHQLIHITADKKHRKLACPRPECPNTFIGLDSLQNHFNRKHGLNLTGLHCDHCDKSFFTKQSLQHHTRHHHLSNLYKKRSNLKCDQCGATFVDEDNFEKHINSGHLFSCLEPGCDQKFDTKRKLMIHRTMKHLDAKRREWNCESCPARFVTKANLKGHISNYHTEIKFTCELCGATFKRKGHLNVHMNCNHNPDRVKSWICSLCGKSYHSVMGLQYHTDSEHKKEAEWNLKCPHCPRRFFRKMYLHRHLKTCKEGESTGLPVPTNN